MNHDQLYWLCLLIKFNKIKTFFNLKKFLAVKLESEHVLRFRYMYNIEKNKSDKTFQNDFSPIFCSFWEFFEFT